MKESPNDWTTRDELDYLAHLGAHREVGMRHEDRRTGDFENRRLHLLRTYRDHVLAGRKRYDENCDGERCLDYVLQEIARITAGGAPFVSETRAPARKRGSDGIDRV